MGHTKDEHQRWWHVRHPLRPSRPTNEFFVFAVEKGPPRKCSRFSGADRFSPCRLHTGIYEPIVSYLGIAGGIVKRATTVGRASRLTMRSRQRPSIRCCIQGSCASNGDSGPAHVVPFALAKWVCLTLNRLDPARVYGSFVRVQRRAPSTNPFEIRFLLQ